MDKTMRVAATATLAGVVALSATACGGGASGAGGTTLDLVGYSVLEQANQGVISAFEKTPAGRDVTVKESYGASGDQSRAVVAGARADEVHLSLEPDVTRLVDEGLVAPDWKDNATSGICTSSVVVFVVPPGNPKGIEGWDDLVDSGVEIVTPNPASSGSAKWNLLAAYGAARDEGGSDEAAQAYMEKFFDNVVALPDSGRDATTAFTSGTGDVLLSYENEAILARQSGQDFDYVVPDETLSIQNPCAVLKDAPPVAQHFVDFQRSAEGQALYAATGYRPLTDVGELEVKGAVDPGNPYPAPGTLLTIEGDFGGWAEADTRFFDEGDGILTTIQSQAGQ